ncbi:hypothetical protein JKY72_06425 [Candidatus Gracilibacteria bacterium]|nr:hypothetical protein [Candidatus Gracilibacteria bacterium]
MGIGEKGLGDTTGASLTSLSPREREYVRVGQQLYKVMAVLRAAYLKTFYKESNLTWEDAMKKYPELRHTKIRHLVHSMKEWAPDSGKLKMAPEKTMNRLKEGFNKLHPDFPIDINDVAGKAGHFQADVMNFPVVFVYNPQKKGFDTYLINNYGGAETPGGNYIQGGTIPLKGGSPEVAAGIIEKAVKARMAKLLKPVRSGPKLKGIDYDFDDGQWRTEIKMRKMPNLGVDAEDGEAIITPYKDGKGVIIKIVNGGTILRLDEAAAAERPTEFSLITNLTRDKRFKAFIPFYNAKPKKLSTKNVDEAKGWFTLMIGDNKFELDMMFHDGKYVPRDLDDAGESAQEKALLKNSAFSREYVEALQSDPMFELNDTIGKLNDVIQYAVDETSIKHFLTSIAGNVNKGTLAGWNSNLISGSVSKNFTRMVLNCTMYESLARLRTHVKGATSLADVEQFRINDLAKVNAKLKAMIRILSVENYKVLGGEEPIDHEEFLSRVVDQVRAASSISGEYAEARENLEHVIYNGMDLPGIFEVSDWNEASHKAVGKMIDVFSYHTAHLDNHKIPDTRPGKDDGDEFYINLDDLDFPATATPDFKGNSWDDPAMRGHYILQYLKYVREQIGTNAAVATKDSISSGRFPSVNSKKWGIAKFEHWAETEGSYEALNPLDDEDPYTHDMEQHKEGKHTKLDLAIIAAYDKTAEFLNKRYDMKQTWEKDKFKAKSNWNGKAMNISKFKALKPAEQKAQGYKKKDIDRWGLYSIGMGGTKAAPEWKSKLWEISKRIQAGSTTASGKVRKSKQVYLIQMEVDTYMRTIFRMSEDAEDYPFRVKPGLWDKHVVTPWRKWRNGIT